LNIYSWQEFVATVRISMAAAEADLAQARAQTGTAGEAAPGSTGNAIAARLPEFAQTAVDEQRAAADTEAAAAKAAAEQTADHLVRTALDAEVEIQAQVAQLQHTQHTQHSSRSDLRQPAQQ
jgi:hypothetical protein